MSKFNDDFGARMKRYETVSQNNLSRRTPVIIRLDGKAFHAYTKGFDRPFDDTLAATMVACTHQLVQRVQGCVLGYTQSDEISLLLRDWDTLDTDAWFDYNVQKMVSISASICTVVFERIMQINKPELVKDKLALFDSRAYNIPKEEVCNYFIWRQGDASRNSVNSLAQSLFSHKSLQGLNLAAVHDKLMLEKNVNWNDLETWKKRGTCVYCGETEIVVDDEIPIFTQDRNYVERHLLRTDAELQVKELEKALRENSDAYVRDINVLRNVINKEC